MPWRLPNWPALAIAGVAAADSVVAAMARPFTGWADGATAVGIAGVLGGLVLLRRRRHHEVGRKSPSQEALPRSAALAWAALALAVAAFELVNFFAAPRREHPTISSLLTVLTGHEVLRGLLFVAWLGAGWWLRGPR